MSRRAIRLDTVAPIVRGYPHAVVADGLVFVSGMRGGRPGLDRSFADLPESFRQNGFSRFGVSDECDFAAEAWTAHENLDLVLRAAGTEASQVLRQHMWLQDKRVFPAYEKVRMAWQEVPAPSSCLGVGDVPGRFGHLIGLEAMAVVPDENPLFPRRSTVRTFDNKDFPSAAFYSQAVRCGPLAFLAGHIPIQTDRPGQPVITGYADIPPEGRFLATGRSHPDSRHGPIAAQTWYTYEKVRENLAAQGMEMSDIKHVAVMLHDVRDFDAFHEVHRRIFGDKAPALIVTTVNEVGHRGTRIEIEPTALDPRAGIPVAEADWPCPAPFAGPAAVGVGGLFMFAGVLGLNAAGRLVSHSSELDDPIGRRVAADLQRSENSPGFAAQCWAAWSLLRRVADSLHLPLDAIAKTTVYVSDARDIWIYEEVRECFLSSVGRDLPAAEFVSLRGPGPAAGAMVQIEASAVSTAAGAAGR